MSHTHLQKLQIDYIDDDREWFSKCKIHSKLSLAEFICRSRAKKLYFTITDLDSYCDVDSYDINHHCIHQAYDFVNKCFMEKAIGVNIIVPSTHIDRYYNNDNNVLNLLRYGKKIRQSIHDFYVKKWGIE